MTPYIQEFQLVEKARHAKIPHGVEVEGIVVGIQLMFPEPPKPSLHELFVQKGAGFFARLRKKPIASPASPQAALPVVKFCGIKRIDFVNLPPGDGKQLKSGAVVYINDMDSIVTEAIKRRHLTRSMRFNARARFYANGALTVEFLSLV